MKEDANGQEAAQSAQQQEQLQEAEAQPVTANVSVSAYEAQIVERDERIKELEEQVADAAKTVETADQLKSQIEELRAQGESDRIEFELRLAGCRNVKAARAVLEDHGGDVSALKEAEPWMFTGSPKKQTGKTGLSNAGAAVESGKALKRWRRLAGLDDSED